MRSKIEFILKHNLFIQKVYRIVMSNLFKLVGRFIVTDDNLILFSALGKKYNDSPKAIYEYLINNEEYSEYKCYWALEDTEFDIPGNAEVVKMDSIRYFYIALKAKYWIACVNIERGLNFKKKETIYLNTWHGIPLKYVGNAVPGREDFDFSKIDYFCYSGEFEKKIYSRDFNVRTESLIPFGLPRNDELYDFSNHFIIELKKKLNIPLNKKIILYAPTWRDSHNKGKSYELKLPIKIEKWEEMLGEKYIVIMRLHNNTNKVMNIEYNDFLRDYSSYPNINELMIISDILVSDYSATIFDYSILEKPIFTFAYDYEQYKNERGLYVNLIEEFPFGFVSEEDVLIDKIININFQTESRNARKFKEKYIEYGGNSVSECVDALFKHK